VSNVLAADDDTNKMLQMIFLPNYTTSKEYLYICSLDVNVQLILPGKQSCATQPLKFTMNGSLLLGSRDATNMRIDNLLGKDVVVLFGMTYYDHLQCDNNKRSPLVEKITNVILNDKIFGNVDPLLKDYFEQMPT